jgi:hypothetical protein
MDERADELAAGMMSERVNSWNDECMNEGTDKLRVDGRIAQCWNRWKGLLHKWASC